ncbi:MAG: hypothetical protein KDA86_23025 [Planctomycetaceae bacterium]|nr:hypothetical protein [Planctomycetaceae bacterium]
MLKLSNSNENAGEDGQARHSKYGCTTPADDHMDISVCREVVAVETVKPGL